MARSLLGIGSQGRGRAFLATVRGGRLPRLHPITVGIADGGLYAFLFPSPKLDDLLDDGRFALHADLDAERPHEFVIRGLVRSAASAERRALAATWPFPVDAVAVEFLIEEGLLAERADASAWPPRYTVWRSSRQSG